MIKLVAIDLDGTVVNEDLSISPKVLATLKYLINETDTRVVIATGRMYSSALPFAESIGVVDPLITYQGAMIRCFNTNKTSFHRPIGRTLAKDVLGYLVAQKLNINLYLNDELWTTPDNKHTLYYTEKAGVPARMTECLLTTLDETGADPTKIMVIDDDRVDELLGSLSEKYPTQLSYCRSKTNFCEIIHHETSKWNAILNLIEGSGIKPEEVMAIGDQGNDISMITGAGLGVAMGNASDELKAVANVITGSIDEDGVVQAIEKYVLNQHALPLA